MTQPPANQTAVVTKTSKFVVRYQVDFYRDGIHQLRMSFDSMFKAQRFAEAWKGGAKQWQLAELEKDWGKPA